MDLVPSRLEDMAMSLSKGRTKKTVPKARVFSIQGENISLEVMPSTAYRMMHEVDIFFVVINGQ